MEDLVNSLNEIMRLMASACRAWSAGDTATVSEHTNPEEMISGYQDLMTFMAQAYLVFMTSGFRYWRRLADIYGRYYPAISRSFLGMNSDPSRSRERLSLLIDDLRACLREMADLPSQESRLLQAELEKIEWKLWPTADAEDEAHYWRRWRAKS
jgi:hypothetical protein